MGSTLGLYHFLLKNNHEPIVIALMNFLISLLGFQAQRPLKYSKRQRKLHRNTGGSRSNFHVGLQCFAPRGWSDGAVLADESAFIMIDHQKRMMICSIHVFRHLFWVHLRNVIQFHLFLDKKTSTRQLEPAGY
jgi:phosphoesterase RecJ-like protein